MSWKELFTRTTLERGRQLNERQRVQNLMWQEGLKSATAEVVGSVVYQVSVKALDENTPIMSCSCAESKNGSCCAHMAALLYAMRDSGYWPFAKTPEEFSAVGTENEISEAPVPEAQKEGHVRKKGVAVRKKGIPARKKSLEDYVESGAVRKGAASVETDPNREVWPFAHIYDEDEGYHYFDLRQMTKQIRFVHKDCKAAQKLIEDGKLKLARLDLGYTGENEGMMEGYAEGMYKKTPNRYEEEVRLFFDRERVKGAMCYASACYRSYDYRYSRGRGRLCVHELALLFLVAEKLLKDNPGDATDLRGMSLLQDFRDRNRAGVPRGEEALADAGPQEYHIGVRLEDDYSDGLNLSFRIGKKRLYVVKDISKLIGTIRSRGIMPLGKKDELDFAVTEPSEKARQWLDFIEACMDEEQERESGGWTTADLPDNSILLYGHRLDEFYDILGEDEVEFTDLRSSEGRRMLTAREGRPDFSFSLANETDSAGTLHGVRLTAQFPRLHKGKRRYYYVQGEHYYCRDRQKLRELEPLLEQGRNGRLALTIGRNNLASFYRLVLPVLEKYGEVSEPEDEQIRQILPPEADYVFYLDADRKNVYCRAVAHYGGEEYPVPHGDGGGLWDMEREEEICREIRGYFPQWDAQKGLFHCGEDEDVIYHLLESGLERLLELGEVQSTESFRGLKIRPRTKVSVGVSVGSEIMNLEVSSEDIPREELLEVLKSYKKKKRFYRLRSGDFLRMNDENLEALEAIMDSMNLKPKDFVKGKLQLPLYRALYLDKLLEENEGLYTHRDAHFRKLLKEFKTVKESDYEVPQNLAGIMRNYQIYGHKWLRTLESCGFGGILADDMGLGKTLQTISVILAAKADLPSLVVCPASLVYNWQEEFGRFAPELRVQTVTGTKEERQQLLADYTHWDVLVTSYDLLKRDIGEYEPLHFSYQIIDEAQYIKNHNTAAAKSVKVIRSRTRYALTGTPIENRLSELWSIFDYLMPGFLYGYDTFRSDYELAITRKKDEEATNRLRRMVSPFILRRLKSDVLKDLPEKMEEVRYARLESEQQKLYDGQVVHMQELLQGHSEEDYNRDKLQILAELTRIRQICCDPRLLFEDYEGSSAKRLACMDLVESAIEGEHRILLFSQFTTMLDLLEKDLDERGIKHYKIVGSTPKEKRSQLVRRFNEGDVPVFLISLKAGGTGLNLTGADVVIHYDPWWNVAAQNQATDRAHRIGQKKVVSVYRLIVKGTIEEKILKLQEEKKNLADQILSGELGGLMDMSREELLELLQ